jgi:hypothetical protein
MTKYSPLKEFLADRSETEVPMMFNEIEAIIGAPLPPVAFKHRAWWSNNPSNSVITRAWLDAGYKTERVDMGSQKLVFRKAGDANRSGASIPPSPTHRASLVAGLQRALGGTVRFSQDFEATEPTGEVWDAEQQ